ncbi:peptidase inhibitor family I36 protein [Amycolatopsis sp. NBC_00345]|uniref:peptidase inhibitor family I36 protein n=1 Tax=Amycolatopsis sp. NBC_00345 TaxID=2975955 RepID=UPI002E2760BE
MSTSKTVFRAALVAIAGSLLVAGAPAAEATVTEYGCPSNYVCWYSEKNFGGVRAQAHYSSLEGQCGWPDGFQAHSLINMSTQRFYWWEYTICSGTAGGLLQPYGQPGYKYSNYIFTGVTHT